MYHFISSDEFNKIKYYINFGNSFNTTHNNDSFESENTAGMEYLINNHLITNDQNNGKCLECPTIPTPRDPFEHIPTDEWPRVQWHHVIIALMSGVRAQLELMFRKLDNIFNNNRNNKNNDNCISDDEKALYLARIYHRLRPVLLKSRVCLFDSLSLYYFCSFYGVRTKIIFGVTADPFEAHCWIQSGQLVLNDAPLNTKRFIPIMVI